MDFVEVMEQAKALLQSKGRMTYRALKYQFQLDSEELQTVVRTYQEVSARVIERYEGYIAQYLGDGLLVYFGYPVAHEDDAARAIRAGVNLPGLTSGAYSNASSACPKSSFS